jgi:hypothetical protein
MGNISTKHSNKNELKITSFNVNLKKSVSLSSRIREIINYLLCENNNFDVIFIQGLYDKYYNWASLSTIE